MPELSSDHETLFERLDVDALEAALIRNGRCKECDERHLVFTQHLLDDKLVLRTLRSVSASEGPLPLIFLL